MGLTNAVPGLGSGSGHGEMAGQAPLNIVSSDLDRKPSFQDLIASSTLFEKEKLSWSFLCDEAGVKTPEILRAELSECPNVVFAGFTGRTQYVGPIIATYQEADRITLKLLSVPQSGMAIRSSSEITPYTNLGIQEAKRGLGTFMSALLNTSVSDLQGDCGCKITVGLPYFEKTGVSKISQYFVTLNDY